MPRRGLRQVWERGFARPAKRSMRSPRRGSSSSRSTRETLSAISAEIATNQAQIDTARERETNRANARARERMVEAESTANAALLEARALDIRAVSSAAAPEILEYRFQQDVLERLAGVADRLPQVIQIGKDSSEPVDFLDI